MFAYFQSHIHASPPPFHTRKTKSRSCSICRIINQILHTTFVCSAATNSHIFPKALVTSNKDAHTHFYLIFWQSFSWPLRQVDLIHIFELQKNLHSLVMKNVPVTSVGCSFCWRLLVLLERCSILLKNICFRVQSSDLTVKRHNRSKVGLGWPGTLKVGTWWH